MRIGVSMRVDTQIGGAPRDAVGHDLLEWLSLQGLDVVLVPNVRGDAKERIARVAVDAWVLSGGGDDTRRWTTERAIVDRAVSAGEPVLGICHGLQTIQRYCGGGVVPASERDGHVATSHVVECVSPWFAALVGDDRPTVNSFHEWVIGSGTLAPGLVPLALDATGNVEAAVHETWPVIGVMWHPERAGNAGGVAQLHSAGGWDRLMDAVRSR